MGYSDALNEYLGTFRDGLRDAGFERTSCCPECWRGEVWVDWSSRLGGNAGSAVHRVNIELPEEFPYRAPEVRLPEETLPRGWHLNPGPPQSLCLWIPGAGWKPYFGAQILLNRIREWFVCYHTGSWPADSEYPDLQRYLEPTRGLAVIGEDWQPSPTARKGRFGMWSFGEPDRADAILAAWSTDYPRRDDKPEERLASHLSVASTGSFQHLVHWNQGIWFRVHQVPVPPECLSSLLEQLDTDAAESPGWAKRECVKVFGEKTDRSGLPLALGYTDGSGIERWLFIWAKFPNGALKRYQWSSDTKHIRLAAFRTAPARKPDLLRRSAFVSHQLIDQRVAVFGLGSLGSAVALLLAKAGVGELQLFDSDVVTPGNVARHACGLGYTGEIKSSAVARLIRSYNPDCRANAFPTTWKTTDILERTQGCGLIIDATASANFSLWLNGICVEHDLRLLVGATYRKAHVGRIVLRRDSGDPCLVCYSNPQDDWPSEQYPIIPSASGESFLEDGCGQVTEEAVAIDVEAIANQTARVAIKVLTCAPVGGNLAFIVNEPVPGCDGLLARPGIYWHTNRPLAACAVCGD